MKLLGTLTSVFLVSSISFACPDLAGSYRSCKIDGNDSASVKPIQITQDRIDKVVSYLATVMNDDNPNYVRQIITDGQKHSWPDDPSGPEVTEQVYSAQCVNDTVVIDSTGWMGAGQVSEHQVWSIKNQQLTIQFSNGYYINCTL